MKKILSLAVLLTALFVSCSPGNRTPQQFKDGVDPADFGVTPEREAALRFAACCPPTGFYIIGDAAESGDIRDAVFQAFEVCRTI